MSDSILKVSSLCKSYEKFYLGPVDIDIPKGTITGLIGENGAGKSTLIKLILGIIKKNTGSIELFGENTDKADPAALKQRIGVVLGEKNFHEALSPVSIDSILSSIYVNWDKSRYEELLDLFAVPRNRPIKELSKGMRMKLSLATALSHNADLLVLDEPTSGLDPVIRDEILEVLMGFVCDENHSILISSHITSDLEKIADYITFIHNGKILLSDEKDTLLERCCIVKCSAETAAALPEDKIMGIRRSDFGTQVLIDRHYAPSDAVIDRATLDDIMLFTIKGKE